MPSFTFKEIRFEDEQLADLEEVAEHAGMDEDDAIRAGTQIFINMYRKENMK